MCSRRAPQSQRPRNERRRKAALRNGLYGLAAIGLGAAFVIWPYAGAAAIVATVLIAITLLTLALPWLR